MEPAVVSPNQVAAALQRYYKFSAGKARSLSEAGLEHIRSPWHIPGMDTLADRLVRALQQEEPLLLFGDFDTDGVTGSAVLFHTLSRYSGQVHRYNPWYHEGYGLYPEQVERFAQAGIRAILTVDTGITSHQAVARASELGLEVLITDHHLPREGLGPPDALYIDPPDHLLSGAQLAYLTAQSLRERIEGAPGHDAWGLALAAVGAQMDWTPVDEPETRAWVAAAHRIINNAACPAGLRTLRALQEEPYTASDLLSLGGVLNMAKRSHRVDPNAVVEALLPDTPEVRCREIGKFLLQEASRAYRATTAITAHALEDVREEIGRPGLLIYQVHVPDAALAEVEGPLASRIVEVTGRPVLVLRASAERIHFAGRAPGAFSFASFLNEARILSLVKSMGGHQQAMGGSFHPQARPAFLRAVRRWERDQPPIETVPRRAPRPVELEQLDPATAYLLGRACGPFGHRLRPLRYETTLWVKGGWAFSGNCPVETDRPLEEGEWVASFRFHEGDCDGTRVALNLAEIRRRDQ